MGIFNRKKRNDNLNYLKVPKEEMKTVGEILREQEIAKLDKMVGRELKSDKDAFENIIELQRYLSYPHDNIPDAADKVYEKLIAIQDIFGADILERGMEIYEEDEMLNKMNDSMMLQDRLRIEQEIVNNPKLAEKLNYLRYNPELIGKQRGKIFDYMAVYSKMTEHIRNAEYSETNNDKEHAI